MHMCTVNSTPTPTERMSVTAGTALSFIPAKPMKPYTSTVIITKTSTMTAAAQMLNNNTAIAKKLTANDMEIAMIICRLSQMYCSQNVKGTPLG